MHTAGPFMGAWFAHVAGGKGEAVHYKGGSAYMTDLLSGELTFAAATLPVYFGLRDRLNVLATLSQRPLAQVPDAPTMTQAGRASKIARPSEWGGPGSTPPQTPAWAPRRPLAARQSGPPAQQTQSD